jgi:hopanoid biosynthesis associated RND transporter like protein HpnN
MRTECDDAERASHFERLLGGLVSMVCRRPMMVLVCSLLLGGASLYWASTRLQFHTQRSDLISARKDYAQRWQRHVEEFGDDDDIVVVVEGQDRARMEQALEQIAGQLAQYEGQLFDRLFYKCDLRNLRSRALLFLPQEQIAQIHKHVNDMRLLLEPPLVGKVDPYYGWTMLSLGSLLDEAAVRIEAIHRRGSVQPADETFLMQMNSISAAAAQVIDDPGSYKNPWQSILPAAPEQADRSGTQDRDQLAEPQYFFSGDSTLAFLLVRPIKEAGSFTGARASVDKLRQVVDGVRPQYADLRFGCTGLPVLENDEMVASENDTRTASWLALAGIALLYLIVFRGVRYPALMVGTLLVGTAWAMGWLTLTVGHLNILSATFAVMLFGMGDYAVLWVMRYEQARQSGMAVRLALLHTTKHVAVGNLTAATTTAMAFYATMFADFKGVAELGWVAGSGILLCAFACFTLLPALLTLLDRRVLAPAVVIPLASSAWLPNLTRRPWRIVAGGLVLTTVAVLCLTRLDYDHNLLHLQPRGLDSVQWQMTLIEHTAGASWNSLSSASTPEAAVALKARFEKLPCVERVVEIASLVPSGQLQKLPLLADIHERLRRLPPRGQWMPHALPDATALRDKTTRVLASLGELPTGVRHAQLTQLVANVQGLETALVRADASAAVVRLQQFDNLLARDLADDLHKLRDVTTPTGITLEDLPVQLRERYHGKTGQWLVQVFAKESARESLWDYGPLAAFCKQIQTVDPEATGKPFGTVEGLNAMKTGFERAGLYAFIAIALVLLFDFRKVGRMLIALTPLAMGLVLALGLLGLSGLPLNPANIIALPLVLGVGVDNGVHLLHDYLIRRRAGLKTVSYPIARGVLVKGLTTMIGFGTLMISSQRGLAGLGLCLTLGVGCCLLASLVFLPAVLRLVSRPRVRRSKVIQRGTMLAA